MVITNIALFKTVENSEKSRFRNREEKGEMGEYVYVLLSVPKTFTF